MNDTVCSNTGSVAFYSQNWNFHFYLACHHFLELVTEATSFGLSYGPEMAMFKHFHSSLNSIEQSTFDLVLPGCLLTEPVSKLL